MILLLTGGVALYSYVSTNTDNNIREYVSGCP